MFLIDLFVYWCAIPVLALLALLWLGWWFAVPAGLIGLYVLLHRVEASDPARKGDPAAAPPQRAPR